MRSFSTRASSPVVVFVALALGACSDQPATTEARTSLRPHLAAGDVLLVTNTTDNNPGSVRLALRQATGGEIIRFDPSLAGATITLDSTLVVLKQVTIEGDQVKGITIDGNRKGTVFDVREGLTLVNATVTGGKSSNIGDLLAGAIAAHGPLVLDHSTLTGNSGSAGALRGDNMTLINSTVAFNTSSADVGAIQYGRPGTFTLINSTVSRNSGGPGLALFGAAVTPTVTLRNSIISNNVGGCRGGNIGFVYEGRNITTDNSCGNADVIDIVDPLVGDLADNGGPTKTLALARNSPAINRGLNCSVAVDQRYVQREAACDLGAFEFIFTAITLNVNSGAQVEPKVGTVVMSGTVKCSRGETFDLTVSLTQDQKARRTPTLVQASRTLPVICETTVQPWIVLLTPPSGQAFENGAAVASAQTVNIAAGVTPATTTKDVQLAWTKKN
jgi:hypothetical protein